MNLIILFMIYSTFLATVHSMHPDFRHRIQTFYEGDFRTVMALYNEYTENNDTKLVNPCQRYSDMELIIDPAEYTSIESDVITSLNTNMVLTLDGHSNFSIHAVMKCAVMNDGEEVFKFFVLLLPKWAKSFTRKNVEFIPVYSYESADENWQLLAGKDVYDFQVLRNTFTGNPQDQLRIRQSLESPQMIPIINETLMMVATLDTVEDVDWKHHLDNFVLFLDEKSNVQIPVITIFKLRVRKRFFRFVYAILFCDDADVGYPPNPFRYTSISNKGFLYQIYSTGEIVNGMFAFSFDLNLVNPKSNIFLIPSFIKELLW